MQKELNPELFGPQATSSLNSVLSQTDMKVAEVRQHLRLLQEQVEKLSAHYQTHLQSTQHRLDKSANQIQNLEQTCQKMQEEFSYKINSLSQRLSSRSSTDHKVQEMLDRHNSVLRSYELRMSHLQKILAEKEAQLMQAQAALNEAKMEIMRLKRL